ncbi:MAG TPA: neutral zinc metallopeptidase [Thiolinea sp.]|nr:neutral zinc metallopeptidase [Thiolinea sp.]
MRWRTGRRSSNIEDRRGGIGGPAKAGGIGLVLMLVVAWLMGADPIQLLGIAGSNLGGSDSSDQVQLSAADREDGEFVSAVMAQTEDVWNPIFKAAGATYREPTLVLFTDETTSGCGYSSAATGPFYCPADQKVYIDLGFFRELKKLGAPGDFARAYVIGHEVAHHVQNLLGTSGKVTNLQRRVSSTDANRLSVLLELQADCYAGVWANRAHQQMNVLEQGDIEEGLQAAASIGDDRMQRMAGRRINPDAFTHGSSEQRMQWFTTGLRYGDLQRCDTFADLQ